MRLRTLTGGPSVDPESVPKTAAVLAAPVERTIPRQPPPAPAVPVVNGWPFDAQAARQMQTALEPTVQTVDLGNGAALQLVRIPAGTFVMGDAQGQPDEQPLSVVTIERPFWMGTTEISNAVYRQFDRRTRLPILQQATCSTGRQGTAAQCRQPARRARFLAGGHGVLRLALAPDRHAFFTPDRIAMGVGRAGRFGQFACGTADSTRIQPVRESGGQRIRPWSSAAGTAAVRRRATPVDGRRLVGGPGF